jgi:hypothetical protein
VGPDPAVFNPAHDMAGGSGPKVIPMADEPKIFIDEGWKAQVQREKEEAAKRATSAPEEAVSPLAAEAEVPLAEGDDEGPITANFTTLIASLATQAMMALGVMAPPGTREVMVDLDAAKFSIDTLAMLQEKTRGNLTEEESAHLEEASVELERIFVARLQQFEEQALRNAGVDPTNLKGL